MARARAHRCASSDERRSSRRCKSPCRAPAASPRRYVDNYRAAPSSLASAPRSDPPHVETHNLPKTLTAASRRHRGSRPFWLTARVSSRANVLIEVLPRTTPLISVDHGAHHGAHHDKTERQDRTAQKETHLLSIIRSGNRWNSSQRPDTRASPGHWCYPARCPERRRIALVTAAYCAESTSKRCAEAPCSYSCRCP